MTTAELLRRAAAALDEGTSPFSEPFLSANEVTFSQCMTLADLLAAGARIMAAGIENPRSPQAMIMLTALAGEKERETLW